MKKYIYVFMLTILMSSGCKTFQQTLIEKGYREIKGNELKVLLSDNTKKSDSGTFFYFNPDGRFYGIGQRGTMLDGKWGFNADQQLYRNWNTPYVESGVNRVFIHEESKDMQWRDPDGQWYKTWILPGNTRGY